MKGLIDIFYEPGKVFDSVRDRGVWLAPFVANLFLGVFLVWYTMQAIGPANITRHQLETAKYAAQMTPEQKEQAIANSATPTRMAITVVVAAIGIGIVSAIFALLYMGIAGISGHGIRFPQALGLSSYAGWPFSVIRVILTIVVLAIAADKSDLDAQHVLAFNAGAFLDKTTSSKFLYSLASSFDLIIFGQMALTAYGLARVAGIKFSRALTGLIVIWIAFSLLGAGVASLFG